MKTLTAIVFLGAAGLRAQDAAIPQGAVNVNLPDNSPLSGQAFPWLSPESSTAE